MTGSSTPDGRRTAPDSPATDDRAVSEIIGAILMFGLVLLLLVVVQATAVPMWNQQTEFEHSQRVQEDWQEFDAAASSVAADGVERTVVVETGVRYPSRPFLLNPPPASGSIETMPARPLVIENADIANDNGYWRANQTFETRALRYRPDYRQYRNGPTTVYESGMLHNRYGDATIMLDDGNLVEGREVNLQVLDGEYSAAQTEPTSFDVQPTSAPARTVRMGSRSANQPIVIRLPTLLDEATLRDEVLGDEIDPVGAPNDPNRYVQSVTVTEGSPYNEAEITLEPGAGYSLTMSEIGVGNVEREGAAYVTRVGGGNLLVRAPSTTELSVEVRDRYNNPVAGETVTFEVTSGDGGFPTSDTVTVQTGPNGRATAEYAAPSTNTTGNEVTASIAGVAPPSNAVTWTIESNTEVGVGGTGGAGPEDAVSTLNPGSNPDVPYIEGVVRVSNRQVRLCFANEGGSREFTEGRISYMFDGNQDKTTANVTRVTDSGGTFAPSPTPSMEIAGDYESLTAVDLMDAGNPTNPSRKQLTFEFDNNFGGDEFFVLSIRYDDGADTVSYIVGNEDAGSCPAP